MTLQDFVKEQVRLLNKFEQHWEKRALRNPQMYPSELESSTWGKQFNEFVDRFEKENER